MRKVLVPVLSFLFLSSALGQQVRIINQPPGNGHKFHPGRTIVRFRGQPESIPGAGAAKALSQQLRIFAIDNPPGMEVAEAIGRYKKNSNVLYAEPDYEVQADNTPNDPLFTGGSQWDMSKIAAPQTWDIQTGAPSVIVAVVDTGIAYNHPDLVNNLWTDNGSVTGVAGAHGYTCVGSCAVGGSDDFGHGTHVAGTIGAQGNNGIGMAGINWSVQLMSFKFLDANGSGNISDAVLAFNKILQLKQAPYNLNIRVTNNSWGGGGFTQSLADAMTAVENAGILNVCAAGNSGVNADTSPMYPAAYDNPGIISVAASDTSDAAASFSNYGLATTDIAAPGVNTWSTVPTITCQLCDPSGYKYLSGTSMATPHVAGVAAGLFAAHTTASAFVMRDVILDPNSFDRVADTRLKTTTTIGGRLNYYKALNNILWQSISDASLNHSPTVTAPANMGANSGDPINLQATSLDPDGDATVIGWTPLVGGSSIYAMELNKIFPTPAANTNPVSFIAPPVSRSAFAQYFASVADGRGGSSLASSIVQIFAGTSKGIPTGSFSASPSSIAVNGTSTLNFNLTDPAGYPANALYWQAWFLSSSVWGEMCCLDQSSKTFGLQFTYAGAYRVSVQGIDPELNLSPKYSTVVNVGGVSGTPPIASASVTPVEGTAPLTVSINMGGSSTPGGNPITSYNYYCPTGTVTTPSPTGSCTFTDPGTYYVWTTVTDNKGFMDADKKYITVLPSGSQQPPPSPDFSLSANPSSQSVVQGSSTSYNVVIGSINGFSGSVSNFSVSGLPSGAGATFSPSTVAAGASTSMSVTTLGTTPTGSFPLTITGTSGSLTHTASVTLVVNGPPDFSLSPSPSSRTVTQGSGTSYTVTVNGLNNFSGSVSSFSASGLPAGANATFNPSSATSGGSTTMSVTTSSSTPTGSWPLTVSGTSGSLTRMTTVTLVVNALPPTGSFTLKASLPAPSIPKGNSLQDGITVQPSGGFNSSVSFTASGLPNGSSATFSPTSATAPNWSSTVTIKTSNGTKKGVYPVTITGTGAGVSSSVTISVNVQ